MKTDRQKPSLRRRAQLCLLVKWLLSLVRCQLWLNTFISRKLCNKVGKIQFDKAKSHSEQQRHLQSARSYYIEVYLAHSFCCVCVCVCVRVQKRTPFRKLLQPVSDHPNVNIYELQEEIAQEGGQWLPLQRLRLDEAGGWRRALCVRLNKPSNKQKNLKLTNQNIFALRGLLSLRNLLSIWKDERNFISKLFEKFCLLLPFCTVPRLCCSHPQM